MLKGKNGNETDKFINSPILKSNRTDGFSIDADSLRCLVLLYCNLDDSSTKASALARMIGEDRSKATKIISKMSRLTITGM